MAPISIYYNSGTFVHVKMYKLWEQDELQQSFVNINILRFRNCMHCKVFSIYVFSQLKWGEIVLFMQLYQWNCWSSLFKFSCWMLNIEKVWCKNSNMSHSYWCMCPSVSPIQTNYVKLILKLGFIVQHTFMLRSLNQITYYSQATC